MSVVKFTEGERYATTHREQSCSSLLDCSVLQDKTTLRDVMAWRLMTHGYIGIKGYRAHSLLSVRISVAHSRGLH